MLVHGRVSSDETGHAGTHNILESGRTCWDKVVHYGIRRRDMLEYGRTLQNRVGHGSMMGQLGIRKDIHNVV